MGWGMDLLTRKQFFDNRHVFEDEDIDLLKERWPEISFNNIPLAWVFQLDEFLCKTKYSSSITEIRQEFGEVIVLGELNTKLKTRIHELEAQTYLVDWDLHMQ